jgi:hypothetical protein
MKKILLLTLFFVWLSTGNAQKRYPHFPRVKVRPATILREKTVPESPVHTVASNEVARQAGATEYKILEPMKVIELVEQPVCYPVNVSSHQHPVHTSFFPKGQKKYFRLNAEPGRMHLKAYQKMPKGVLLEERFFNLIAYICFGWLSTLESRHLLFLFLFLSFFSWSLVFFLCWYLHPCMVNRVNVYYFLPVYQHFYFLYVALQGRIYTSYEKIFIIHPHPFSFNGSPCSKKI